MRKPRPRRRRSKTATWSARGFMLALLALHVRKPEREFRFSPTRRWRLDFAWPEFRLAVEIEGGVYTRGRHVSPIGFMRDMEKYNALTHEGWSLLRFTPSQVKSGEAAAGVREWFNGRELRRIGA